MIKLPFRWRLFVSLIRTPRVLDEYWTNSKEESERLVKTLQAHYRLRGQDVRVRSQYMIQVNRDRVVVFEGGEEVKVAVGICHDTVELAADPTWHDWKDHTHPIMDNLGPDPVELIPHKHTTVNGEETT